MSDFTSDWRRFYGDAPPLSFALRDVGVGHWLRFHSLPRSKRYAETTGERRVVVGRANAIAREVLEDSQCWLVQAGADEQWASDAVNARVEFGLQRAGEYAYDDIVWPVYAALTTFRTGVFDTLIADIADDRAFRTLWMRPDDGRVFAPYDGGMDLFLESRAEVNRLAAAYRHWLSDRDDGM